MKIFMISMILLQFFSYGSGQVKLFVSVNGSDKNEGTLAKPFKTPGAALTKALTYSRKNVIIEIRGGFYSLNKTLTISSGEYKPQSLTIQPHKNENVTFRGSRKIDLQWELYKDGIFKARLNISESPDQLFFDGINLHMARYPNYDSSARVFNGTAPDAISDARVNTWKTPAGGYIHALHQGEWGDFHYRITGKDRDEHLTYEGGWQNNRPAPMHEEYRFIENVFEELDAPGEWFYDHDLKTIYLYPPKGTDIKKAEITITSLTDLLHITGNRKKPVKNISINNISFTQTARTFMLVKEPLLRSDWAIYRGGAILLDGTEQVAINKCTFSELGGNAVFLSNYNKNDTVRDNHIFNTGGNAIVFVGSPGAVRSPAFRYELFVPWNEMDLTPGPKGQNYPQYCTAEGNLINNIGTLEKQTAGVEISMSSHITIRHNTIYKVPRSGINIGDGCYGGHIIEYNDVFNTVMETGDHGAFNSWGRDRYWRPERSVIDSIVAAKPGIELLDVISPVIIRNNRFQCDHGWDIDLDDGSTNYLIYNNVCLNGGLKLREGYHRTVTNNILVNNTFHPHVWLKNSGDIFCHNIVTLPYAPVLMSNYGKNIDSNVFLTKEGLTEAQRLGLDKHSIMEKGIFVDAMAGNYHVKNGSPALTSGFKNFEMNFGVTLTRLRKVAEKPRVKPLLTTLNDVKGMEAEWLGASFKNIESPGERSAAGLHNYKGALLVQLPLVSVAAKNNLEKGDVIIVLDGHQINSITDLLKVYQNIKWTGRAEGTIVRNQEARKVSLFFKY